MSGPEAKPSRTPVVGVGASAGGVEALQTFFEALPGQTGAAFVVVIHLAPEYRSELASILGRKTQMPVEEVKDNLTLEPDHVYVIPPDRRLQLTDTQVGAFPFEQPRGRRAPIDLFFRSLAEQYGDGCAIVLSGGGSDGAAGVRAVKEQGGVILVQDPKEAAFDGMPRAAIATGAADFVLPVGELAGRLSEVVARKLHLEQTLKGGAALGDGDQATLGLILDHLRARTGHDFSQYKHATTVRRLARRMQVQGRETLGDYLRFLRENVEEAQALFEELLISVTTFFRDPEAWDALRGQVIVRLFDERDQRPSLRVWVPGCATGEEAYTLAMLMLEEAERRGERPEIHLFASDLDEGALATAREGRYPLSVEADISEERLERFFNRDDDHYRVTAELRDCVVFASHSLLRDPPFSRLDLISCRNLLIYLDRELQEKVFGILRYALRPGGYLFLGASENAEGDYFRTLDKRHHIFHARELSGGPPPLLPGMLSHQPAPSGAQEGARGRRPPAPSPPSAHRALLEDLGPPSLLVDEHGQVLHLSETAGRYLQPPGGPLVREVTALVRPELQPEVSAGLFSAFDKGEGGLSPFVPVRFNGTARSVAVLVRPRRAHGDQERLALVVFIEGGEWTSPGEAAEEGEASAAQVRQLRDELQQTQTRLRASREESESANEELRAANEELQSLNEEYRSTAEELETSKEELQSINEELQTVNNELKTKLEEISRAHNDLENLIASSDVGTLFLDRHLRIKRFTPQVTELFRIKYGDSNRPITDLTHSLDYDELAADARRVLVELAPVEREAQRADGHWFLVRLRPYRTMEDRIEGVIISFVDITRQKRAEESLREADRRKDQFLGLLGHELRNPLAAIANTVSVLQMSNGPAEKTRRSIDLIDRQLRHLLRLVDDLLNLTRISRGQIALKKAPMDLAASVTDALEQIRPQMEKRGIALDLDMPGQALPVEGDRQRATQIVANLLSNAVRYTDQGGRITVRAGQTDEEMVLRVRDTGIGIEPDQLPDLFKPFSRLEPALGRHRSGLGLGLTLARQLAELHGGRLEAFSAGAGQGSEFTLRLPAASRAGHEKPAPGDAGSEIPARRVLVVEDEEAVGAALAMLLENLGQEVRVVTRGSEAAGAVEDFDPAVVILDIGLPDKSGDEVARELRQAYGTEGLLLVALTGYGEGDDGDPGTGPFDHYLLKPASVKQLEEIIRQS